MFTHWSLAWQYTPLCLALSLTLSQLPLLGPGDEWAIANAVLELDEIPEVFSQEVVSALAVLCRVLTLRNHSSTFTPIESVANSSPSLTKYKLQIGFGLPDTLIVTCQVL